jgi:hypothetical protein
MEMPGLIEFLAIVTFPSDHGIIEDDDEGVWVLRMRVRDLWEKGQSLRVQQVPWLEKLTLLSFGL